MVDDQDIMGYLRHAAMLDQGLFPSLKHKNGPLIEKWSFN